MEPNVTLTQSEYNNFLKDRRFLNALYAAGVDNWEGYSIAKDMINGEEEEER